MNPRIVWGIGSARAFRVHWALHELGLDYETKLVRTRTPAMDTPEFQAISPRKKIPVFEDGDLTLFESAAIINYLARTYGEGDRQLIPSDPADRAHCDEWCYFVAMELDATSLYVIRRHGDLPEIYGEAPAAVECAAEYFARQIMVPEQKLSDEREFILGSAFSIADVMLTSCVTWAIRYGQPVPDRLISYRKNVVARPAYQTAFAVCYPDL
jgi:glutathione S-transferase